MATNESRIRVTELDFDKIKDNLKAEDKIESKDIPEFIEKKIKSA